MNFSDLGLKPELLRAVVEKGYTVATPIQSQAIPAVLAGRDVLAGAQTGTGKTAAFVLPLLQRLGQRSGRAPRVLVLTPTRELAAQVAASAVAYGKHVDLRTEVVFGGVNINPQIDRLRSGCDLLVATPGRLLDLIEQRAVTLQSVETFVLDEADRMLDMGFIRDIKRVIKLLPANRQNLLFSATYSDDMRELATSLLHDPAQIEVTPRNATADKVDQCAYRVPKDHKRHLLTHLIQEGQWHQVLIFTRTKHGANRLMQQLERAGIQAAAIHGNKSQNARVRALEDFKVNRVTALVATEVAARGLDIKELPYVVNYELPNVPEDYVHRIGRTARAGSTGRAVSLVSPDEAPLLRDIEKLLKRPVAFVETPKFAINEAPLRSAESRSDVAGAGETAGRVGQPRGEGHGHGQRRGNNSRRGRSGGQRQGGHRSSQPTRAGEHRQAPRNVDANRGERIAQAAGSHSKPLQGRSPHRGNASGGHSAGSHGGGRRHEGRGRSGGGRDRAPQGNRGGFSRLG
jgi:ATP-dependent RNA helicase RhlE